jgi:hypothetical protein
MVLTMYFTNLDEATHATVTFTSYTGDSVNVTLDKKTFKNVTSNIGTLYGVVVDQLVISDISQMVSVKVYNDTTEIASASDSIESYLARMSEKGSIYNAVATFATSARNYLISIRK